MAADDVDHILEQWREVRPDLEPSPMGIWGRISRIERLAAREIATTLGAHGLHPSEFDVLATLRRHGGALRPVDLRSGMMVGSGTITHRIDLLEAAGLVQRVADETDRRGRVIELTPAGRRVVDEAVVDHLTTEAALLADVPEAVRRRLAQDLSTVLQALLARSTETSG
jgi:DNA-binding MarR family transcriptional regulator